MNDVVIVTGASSGIGAATARLLGAAGASVVVNYRSSRDLAEAVVADVIAAGGRAVAIGDAMGYEADVVRLVAETELGVARSSLTTQSRPLVEMR